MHMLEEICGPSYYYHNNENDNENNQKQMTEILAIYVNKQCGLR